MIGKDFAQHLFSLRDRVAFVTGAGSGIGQTIACSLASAGARVVCFDLRDDGGLAETVSHIESIGGQACSYNGDVRQIADLRAAVALAKSRYGRLDIAVNALLDDHISHVLSQITALQALEKQLVSLRASCNDDREVEACGVLAGISEGNMHQQ